jgi:hypothetical protein
VLDSGTEIVILFRAPTSAPTRGIRTATGSASLSPLQSLRLRIGDREYRPAQAASIPRVAEGESGDGLIPASLFRAVFISNSGQYAILDPDLRR